jgi:adenosylcobinamide-GDP ribazoletransferase
MASLILAVRFLTIVPVPGRAAPGPTALGRAAWWFPVVGLALGGALAAADRALNAAVPPLLASVLVVTAWMVVTGGLHLDGLADCADALGGATRARRHQILADSRIGVFGAGAMIASFAIACAAMAGIAGTTRAPVLILAPAVGRLSPLLLGAWLRSAAPPHGLGASFLGTLPRSAGVVHLALVLGMSWLLMGHAGPPIGLGALAVSIAAAARLARHFDALTGDVLGAAVTLAELTFLVLAAAAAHRGLVEP